MLPNPRFAQIWNGIGEAREYFHKDFMEKGMDYTKGYLSAFTGIRKFLAEQSLSAESNKYWGAKVALEKMLE